MERTATMRGTVAQAHATAHEPGLLRPRGGRAGQDGGMALSPLSTSGVAGAAGRVGEPVDVRTGDLRLSGRPLPVVSPARVYVCGITPYDVTHLGHAAT